MKLNDWENLTGILPTHPTTEKGAVSVVVADGHHKRMLWNLSDYKVSTVSGPVVWLVPTNSGVTHSSLWRIVSLSEK